MPREKTLASMEIGPLAVQMLVARRNEKGDLSPINEYVANTRLMGDAKSPELEAGAMERTVQAAKEMQDIALQEGVSSLFICAGSAIRDVANKSAFLLLCKQRLGIYPQLLGGKDEARLNFLGAGSALGERPALVLGIGALTSQIAFGAHGAIACASSIKLGTLSMENLFGFGASGSLAKQRNAFQRVVDELQELPSEFIKWKAATPQAQETLVSGSLASGLAARLRGQAVFDFKGLDLTPCSIEELLEICKEISRNKGKFSAPAGMADAETAPFMLSGLILLHCLLTAFKVDAFKTSSSGSRTGLLLYFGNSQGL